MKISVSKEAFCQALQMVQTVVGTRTTLPVLANVLLLAEEKHVELRATDLEVSMVVRLEAQVGKVGATTLPARRLFGLVREIDHSEIEISVSDKEVCTVQAGGAVYKLNGIAADEYPAHPKFKEEKQVVIPQAKLKEMLRKTEYAVSQDESRPTLNGIFTSIQGDKLVLVATDGRRLAMTEEEIEGGGTEKAEFIMPAKCVGELSRLLGNSGQAGFRISETQVEITLTNEGTQPIKIFSKLIEGNYPNYRQVIPKESKERIALGREELLHALRRAEQVTSDKANSVKFSFTKNNLAITVNSPDVGEGRESIAINYKGPDIDIAFNPTYVLDPLKILDAGEVYLEITDGLSPGVLKTTTPFLYVLMPMRT
ncbi:MAG: DNA polymerase III subunit beta [Pedosphaera sp.]|nr:DNA polymerase III subunit beta [Pedosphaera sp.]MSU43807.1 DNA polymerase III subunit beta [Pedosphaera sp.]